MNERSDTFELSQASQPPAENAAAAEPMSLKELLRIFRRQVRFTRIARFIILGAFFVALVWTAYQPDETGVRSFLLVAAAGVATWLLLVIHSFRLAQEVQTAGALLSLGQLDNAEVWLRRAIRRFSFSLRGKLFAGQQLASLFFRRDDFPRVVSVCRELLRHRFRGMKTQWVTTRLLLADSLLMLGRIDEAYNAMRPVYTVSLSLADRIKLLPIQLRYELAADHSESAVRALAEKVRVAELLDSPRAALVHALLAEACRREKMEPEQNYLTERAVLYHDLEEIVDRYPVIAPIVYEVRPNERVSDANENTDVRP
jgi:hypothetical protein